MQGHLASIKERGLDPIVRRVQSSISVGPAEGYPGGSCNQLGFWWYSCVPKTMTHPKPPTMTDQIDALIAAAVAAMTAEVEVLTRLLTERNRILEACPCPVHGPCVPHVLEVLASDRAEVERLKMVLNSPPAQMSSPLGLVPIDSTGMRQVIDALATRDAALVEAVAEEREACAHVVTLYWRRTTSTLSPSFRNRDYEQGVDHASSEIARLIRARGTLKG